MKNLLILICLLQIPFAGHTQTVKTSEITDFGLFDVQNPDKLLVQTDSIEMKIGNSFGFHFKIIADPDNKSIPLTMKITITDKQGKVQNLSYNMNYPPHAFSTGRHTFVFEAPDELIPGTWNYSIEYAGVQLLEKMFYVE